jgi:hypothetical protein
MDRSRVLLLAGLAAFVLTLLLRIPAAVALGWIAPAGSQIIGASGTLWAGSAASVSAAGMQLGATRWTLSPLAFLRGRLGLAVETRLGDADIAGDLSLATSGFDCENCSFRGPVASLQPLAPALRALSGEALVEISSLAVRDRWPTVAVGTISLKGVPIAAPGMPAQPNAPRGSFEATVNADPVPADGLIGLTLQDSGGPLELAGQIELRPPGNYELTGRARARAQAPPDIVNALNVLGPRAADGSTEISMSGTF